MADNYLEYRMENLRQGKRTNVLRSEKPKIFRGNVYVPDFLSSDCGEIKRLVAEGYCVWVGVAPSKLASGEVDLHRAMKLARTLGCRFAPQGFPLPPETVTIERQ